MARRKTQLKIIMVATLIGAITLMHFGPPVGRLGTHLLHRELYFFPILLAGFWFGLRGGVMTAGCVSLIYTLQFAATGILDDVATAVGFQVLVFMAVGLFLGGMVDRQERRRRERDQIQSRLTEERLQQRAMNIQLETATKIQSLFRPKIPDLGHGSHVWADSRPARYVGGDLYDIIPMADRSWLVYVADVSDKGLPAALIMAALWYRIHNQAHLHDDVGKLLTALNRPFHDLVAQEGYFATIFIGRYWPASGKFEYANGGHPPALKVGRERWAGIAGERGMSLGVMPDSRYETRSIRLRPGEAILLMTDGITEVISLEKIQHGIDRRSGPPYGRRLLEQLGGMEADIAHGDDLTLLEIWRDPDAPHISRNARRETKQNTPANTPPPGT